MSPTPASATPSDPPAPRAAAVTVAGAAPVRSTTVAVERGRWAMST